MKGRAAFWIGVAALAATAAAGVRLGPRDLGWTEIGRTILAETGLSKGPAPADEVRAIVWHIRIPRVLVGILAGAVLGLAGALLQGILRNPLASPDVVGVSTGGAVGATAALAAGWAAVSVWAVPLCAFAGALGTAFLVFALATRHGRTPVATVILCGLAINSIGGALVSLILSFSVEDWEVGRQIVYWLMGSLTESSWEHVLVLAPFVTACALGAAFLPRELNLVAAGEESARALGVDTVRVTRGALTLAAAGAGAAVAAAGVIGFVGLLVPHMVRLAVGPDHRRLLPASMLFGALFLSAVDLLGRTLLADTSVRLGILTSALGGPFFLILLLRHRRRAETL